MDWFVSYCRTHDFILLILIWIFDFGPKRLPGLSRDGPQHPNLLSLSIYYNRPLSYLKILQYRDERFACLTTENLFVRQGKKRIQDRRGLYNENLSKQRRKVNLALLHDSNQVIIIIIIIFNTYITLFL